MIDIHHLWATPFWKTKLNPSDNFNESLVEFSHKLMKESKGVVKSNRGGWQSRILNSKEFGPLFKNIYDVVGQLPIPINKITLEQAWINVNVKNDWNTIHQHGHQYELSGTYFVKTPKNCGNFVFRDPRPAAIGHSFWNSYFDKGEEFWVQPYEGLLLLFPPYLEHIVEPNKTDEERISISFDLKL